jgi:hypothetical protein
LAKVEAALDGSAWRDAVDALDEDVGMLSKAVTDQDGEVAWLRRRNAALEHRLEAVEQRQRQTRGTVTRLHKGLQQDWEARQATPRTPLDEANTALCKAVASFLEDGCTRAQAKRVTEWVYKSFGRRGGQAIPYDRELASTLVLTKSITPDEHQNWRTYGRLPDGVDLRGASANRAQGALDHQMQVAQMLAGLNVSPLFLQHLLRSRQ